MNGMTGTGIPAATRAPVTCAAAGCAAITCATLIAVSPLVPAYGSVALWLSCALPAAMLGCLIAWCDGGVDHWRRWLRFPLLLTAQLVVGPLISAWRSWTAGGRFDASSAADVIRHGWSATVGSFKLLVALTPPVGSMGSALMAVWTMALFTAHLAATLARRDPDASAEWTLLPLSLGFGAAALLGTKDGWHPAVAGSAFPTLMLLWLAWRRGAVRWQRWRSVVMLLVPAIVIALIAALPTSVGAGPFLAARRLTLRDHYRPPLHAVDRVSPLSAMRATVKRHRDDPMLTVTGLPAGTPVRLAVMDRFDGNVWNLSGGDGWEPSGMYRRTGTHVGGGDPHADDNATADDAAGAPSMSPFTATFTIRGDWQDHWLPLAGDAETVTFDDAHAAESFYANAGTGTGMLAADLANGLRYVESGTLPTATGGGSPDGGSVEDADLVIGRAGIDMAALATADAGTVSQSEPVDVPDSVRTFATATAGGETRAGAKAIALASALRRLGWFSHGLDGDHPSPPGHGNRRVDELLTDGVMVGDGEQYASAMALMARELGIPSRVVVGLLPMDEDGRVSAARTERTEDGSASITFTGLDVTAWTEVNLAGYGWVAFHPTPPQTKRPDDGQRAAASEPQTLVRQPPVPLTEPLRDHVAVTGSSAITGDDAAPDDGDTPQWEAIRRVATIALLAGSPLWMALVTTGVILLGKALTLERQRRRGPPGLRIEHGWRSVLLLAYRCGVHGAMKGGTPEAARIIAGKLEREGDDADTAYAAHDTPSDSAMRGHMLRPLLDELARMADQAAFSGQAVGEGQARRFWKLTDRARKLMLRTLPWRRRWRARLSLARPSSKPSGRPKTRRTRHTASRRKDGRRA